MTLALALAVAILFGCGSYLVLQRDLVRLVVGLVLISNSATLFILATGLSRGRPPIYPLPEGAEVSDPLVQAMGLTALVISSSVAVLLLGLVYRLYRAHGSIDISDMLAAEERDARRLEEREPEYGIEGEEEPRSPEHRG